MLGVGSDAVGVEAGVGADTGVGLEVGVGCVSVGDAEGMWVGGPMQLTSAPKMATIKIQVVNRKRRFLF